MFMSRDLDRCLEFGDDFLFDDIDRDGDRDRDRDLILRSLSEFGRGVDSMYFPPTSIFLLHVCSIYVHTFVN